MNMMISIWNWVSENFIGYFLSSFLILRVEAKLRDRREVKNRRLEIFRTLMRTRANWLSQEHVDSLNAIAIEFHGEQRIIECWNNYFDHLDPKGGDTNNDWQAHSIDLFINLLQAMSDFLGYKFSASEITNTFKPIGHFEHEARKEKIEKGLAALLSGELSLGVKIENTTKTQNSDAA